MNSPHKRSLSRGAALSIVLGAGLPLLFILVLAFILQPLLGLLLVLALVIAAGLTKDRLSVLIQALRKPRKTNDPYTPVEKTPSQHSGQKHYMMLVSINAANQQRIVVNDLPFIIGRDEDCSYRLDHSAVSRQHLSITYNEGDKLCYAQDLSTNGTYLNSRPMPRGGKMPLRQGDTLQISGVIFSVEYLHY